MYLGKKFYYVDQQHRIYTYVVETIEETEKGTLITLRWREPHLCIKKPMEQGVIQILVKIGALFEKIEDAVAASKRPCVGDYYYYLNSQGTIYTYIVAYIRKDKVYNENLITFVWAENSEYWVEIHESQITEKNGLYRDYEIVKRIAIERIEAQYRD